MRTRATAVVIAGVTIVAGALSQCSMPTPESDLGIATGTSASKTFAKYVDYFGLTSVGGAPPAEWLDLETWDSNEIYLRIETDRAGAQAILQNYGVAPGALERGTPNASALPSQSSWAKQIPRKYVEWKPQDWGRSRMINDVTSQKEKRLPLWVDVLIENRADGKSVVFLHALNT
jgi:hypothetical protein